ncbi:DUF5956 family protein [Streptomyces sp. H27-H5]|uniref:DUF5956 family protein n=1 Tax=Streptomyces sp. H27-H5 TaxID=2996460 RepID=UPI00227170FC|nr:DUF5956 family protein [Streptomyces sp. H27-H5]MCY0961935.1 DUF5956 family protein [Streptomyces sp. H27-H5]
MSWDETGSPHPLAQRRTGRSEQEPDRLPEIRELAVLGWEPAPENATWVFLPYVWPPSARTWIPDRGTHWAVESELDGRGHITRVECAPLPAEDVDLLDAESVTALADLGLPPRPRGRLWLLRPVGPFDTVDAVLDHLHRLAEDRAVDTRTREFVTLVRTELDAYPAPDTSTAPLADPDRQR